MDQVRRVNPGERLLLPLIAGDLTQRVGGSGIRHKRDDRDGNDRIPPYRRLVVPSHGRDRLIAAQMGPCIGRNSAWGRRKCGS